MIMSASENIANLVAEYKSMLEPATDLSAGRISHDPEKLQKLLIAEGAWTPGAAEHLLRLSKEYGAFMLRKCLDACISA